MGSKPQYPTMCLECSCQISSSSNTIREFHKWNANMCHTKLQNEHTEKKINNQFENATNKSIKIHMLSWHINDHSCKKLAQSNISKPGK